MFLLIEKLFPFQIETYLDMKQQSNEMCYESPPGKVGKINIIFVNNA